MSWKETSAMDQRIQLLADWMSGDYTKRELGRMYGISCPTTDKWIARYQADGASGLAEQSRAPHRHPNQIADEVRERIGAEKLKHQDWGPKKVMDLLRREWPQGSWPADSTAGSQYHASPRPYPAKLPPIEYDGGIIVRRVRHNGELRWRGHLMYVSEVLATEPLGLKAIDNENWELRYSFHVLGTLNERTKTITPAQGWHGANVNNV